MNWRCVAMRKTWHNSLYRCSVRSRLTDDPSVAFQPLSSFFSCFSKGNDRRGKISKKAKRRRSQEGEKYERR